MGGVRFKYQPVNSGRSTEEDLKICMNRCDAILCDRRCHRSGNFDEKRSNSSAIRLEIFH